MSRSLMQDAFDHHVWATLRLFETCDALDPNQLQTNAPGTYGSIIDTMRHIVGADGWYLSVITEGRIASIDEERMDLAELRAAMQGYGTEWSRLLAGDLDPDTVKVSHHRDGSESHAPMGIRLAQALHHGTDHRSQICTALTSLGVEPPDIDLWAFGEGQGSVVDVGPGS